MKQRANAIGLWLDDDCATTHTTKQTNFARPEWIAQNDQTNKKVRLNQKALGGAIRAATIRRRLSFPAVRASQSLR